MLTIKAMTVGPIIGHTGNYDARIWGRAKYKAGKKATVRRAHGIARIRPVAGTGETNWAVRLFKMNPNFDMTGVAIFSGLAADTEYQYQAGWFFSEAEPENIDTLAEFDWSRIAESSFRTASDDRTQARELAFGSCRYFLKLLGGKFFTDNGDKTFRSIVNQIEGGRRLDRFLMLGDQIYADDLNIVAPDQTADEYCTRYREAFSQPHLRRLMGMVPTYMMLDDHEIEDNWPKHASPRDMRSKYFHAMRAYSAYQQAHSPLMQLDGSGKLSRTHAAHHYTFSDGCCEFFVADTRTERNENTGKIMSDAQHRKLREWLSSVPEDSVKFIATSVPFFPDIEDDNSDKWGGYLAQRDIIIDHIRHRGIRKVVFLSGDVHCSFNATIDVGSDDSPLHVHSVVSSPFYWPYSHMEQEDFDWQSVETVNRNRSYRITRHSEVLSDDNFTRLRVTPDSIEISVYRRKEFARPAQQIFLDL
ncbi:alkaline phosphatase D family protein [Photobacterium gaetbulicola]|uniref:alkaline phosphatase D family protein n=1 Tax=Photobacterium gaetbulicola TaxID=1295392 RepID=UPI00068CAFE0|nr:alkaline phosphatase D family protein [Photobacterium gaetbulicola]